MTSVDLFAPDFKSRAYEHYSWLRKNQPVYPVVLKNGFKAVLLTRYSDIMNLFRDSNFTGDAYEIPEELRQDFKVPFFMKPIERNLLSLESTDHTRLRGLVNRAFSPKRVEVLRQRIESLTHELIDKIKKQPGEINLIREYGFEVPTVIIAELLGIPLKDRERFNRFSGTIVQSVGQARNLKTFWGYFQFLRFVRHVANHHRRNPQDNLVTDLVEAQDRGELTEDENIAILFLLVIAGHETTLNLISTGVYSLLQFPEQLEKLRQRPDLIAPATEEIIRFASPVEMSAPRHSKQATELHGVKIEHGWQVIMSVMSANRDETQFTDPEKLDIERTDNKHLGFGFGAHYCVGAPLARLEGAIAIQNLIQAFPNLRLAKPTEPVEWHPAFNIRGLKQLPVLCN
jgi:cytochrome P450